MMLLQVHMEEMVVILNFLQSPQLEAAEEQMVALTLVVQVDQVAAQQHPAAPPEGRLVP